MALDLIGYVESYWSPPWDALTIEPGYTADHRPSSVSTPGATGTQIAPLSLLSQRRHGQFLEPPANDR